MEKRKSAFWTLLSSAFMLSAFTFGGGYVIVPLMKKRYVEDLRWIGEGEMLDMIALAQSSPGPIAVNASIMIGYRFAGVRGAALSVLGTVAPPLVILSAVSMLYAAVIHNEIVHAVLRGMQAGVAAVVVNAVLQMGAGVLKEKRPVAYAIMAGAFIAVFFLKVSVVWVILACIGIGVLTALWAKRKEKEKGR